MLKGLGEFTVFVPEPVAGMSGDIKFAIGIQGLAMASCLVMRAGAMHRSVILCHVEVERPGPQRGGEFFQSLIQCRTITPVEVGRQDAVFRRIIAQQVQKRMGHICLEADIRTINRLQGIDHRLPAVHATPADLTFCCQFFAVVRSYITGFAEGFCDQFCIAHGIFCPGFRLAGRIDPDDAIRTNARIAQFLTEFAGALYHIHEHGAVLLAAHGRATPDGGHQRADVQVQGTHFIGQALDAVICFVDIEMRFKQSDINAIEFHAICFCIGGEVDECVQIDRRFRIGSFAHDAGPGCIVQFGIVVLGHMVAI